jgi:RHS repeat-associated protein
LTAVRERSRESSMTPCTEAEYGSIGRTDTSYYRARYYDPSTGRFLSQDPIRYGGGVNFYQYARNNAVFRVDPFGYQSGGVCNDPAYCVPGSPMWGTMYLGPDGVWYNDGPVPSPEPPPNPNKCDWGNQPTNQPPPPPEPLPPPQSQPTRQQVECSRATYVVSGLGATAAMNGLGALLTGGVTPVSWYFEVIGGVETVGAGAMGIYAAYV